MTAIDRGGSKVEAVILWFCNRFLLILRTQNGGERNLTGDSGPCGGSNMELCFKTENEHRLYTITLRAAIMQARHRSHVLRVIAPASPSLAADKVWLSSDHRSDDDDTMTQTTLKMKRFSRKKNCFGVVLTRNYIHLVRQQHCSL